ncbi:hypothetical protein MTO96_015576 [Rhipicephalus appendiculatus]
MLVTMLKSMLHEYAQRRHSSHEVHGTAALLRPGTDGATTPRRYSEDAQHWIAGAVYAQWRAAASCLHARSVSIVADAVRDAARKGGLRHECIGPQPETVEQAT